MLSFVSSVIVGLFIALITSLIGCGEGGDGSVNSEVVSNNGVENNNDSSNGVSSNDVNNGVSSDDINNGVSSNGDGNNGVGPGAKGLLNVASG